METLSALADYRSPDGSPSGTKTDLAAAREKPPGQGVAELGQEIARETEKAKLMAAATDPLVQCWYYLDSAVGLILEQRPSQSQYLPLVRQVNAVFLVSLSESSV